MKILVTGGAGFIGSHMCDRLLSLGHEVTVLDVLTRPVQRNGRLPYLAPGTDFYQGDTRDRDLVTNLLRRVDAVYHFADYQDYLPIFSRFFDVNVVSTALLYEIIVAERLDLARVVVASSQSAMGEGLYWCPVDGEQTPRMRPESALAAGQWDIPCPVCGGPMELRATPERISNPQNAYGISKLSQEMIAINLGRRYGIPTVALRYSSVQGPRQSIYNAYSGVCRIFCLRYLLGQAPVLYEDGGAIRDYVNIEDVVDANVLVLWDDRASGRVFNVGGGQAVTTWEFADIVMRQYGSDQPGVMTGEYRFGDARHSLSDISALRELGWEPRRAPARSVAAYAAWLSTRASRIRRPLAPIRSEITLEIFSRESSRIFSMRFWCRTQSCASRVRSRVSARRSRICPGGTNERRSMPHSFSLHSHTQSSLSLLERPGRCLTSRALTSHTSRPAASARQYQVRQ